MASPVQPKPSKKRAAGEAKRFEIWRLLTVLTICGTVAVSVFYTWIYFFPYTPLNPFPPLEPTKVAVVVGDESIVTETFVYNTETPTQITEPTTYSTATPVIEDTATPDFTSTTVLIPSITHTPNATLIEITPFPEGSDPSSVFFTPTATLRITYLYRYVLQAEPYAIAASSHDPLKGCDWTGVGGQIFDIQGRPATGITVQFGGSLENDPLDVVTTLSGTATLYGKAGYEFQVSDKLVNSYLSLWVQLVDQSGSPLSAKTTFSTDGTCDTNLTIINFMQVR